MSTEDRTLVEALAEQISRYEHSGVATDILDPQLLHASARILLAIGPPAGTWFRDEDRLDAVQVVAVLHQCRFQELPEQDCQPDIMAAGALYMLLLPHRPDAVPVQFRELLEGDEWTLPCDGASVWAEVCGTHLAFGALKSDRYGLDDGAALAAQALAAAAADHPLRWDMHYRQGRAMLLSSDASDNPEVARAAMRHVRAALTADPPDDQIPEIRASLYLAWRAVVAATPDLAEVEEILRGAEVALTAVPDDHPDRLHLLRCLSLGYAQRYNHTQRIDALRSAIEVTRMVVAWGRPSEPKNVGLLRDHAAALHLAGLLIELHTHDDQVAHLLEAIEWLQAALAAPEAGAFRPSLLHMIAMARMSYYEMVPTRESREAGIDAADRFLAAGEGSAVDRIVVSGGRAGLLRDRAFELGGRRELTESIAELERCLSELPETHPALSMLRIGLGTCLFDRYRQTHRHEDLLRAERLLRQAESGLRPGSTVAGRRQHTLGLVLAQMGQVSADVATLREAADQQREALAGGGLDMDRVSQSAAMAITQQALASLNVGTDADPDTGIEPARARVAGQTPGTAAWAMHLTILSHLLVNRFQRWGGVADLQEAIECVDKAVAASPPQHVDQPGRLATLGMLLMMRAVRLDQPVDLTRAVAVQRLALEAVDPHEVNAGLLLLLGQTLGAQYLYTRDRTFLDEAINHVRTAVNLIASRPVERVPYLLLLASLLSYAVIEEPDQPVLDEVTALCRQVAADVPPYDSRRAAHLLQTGQLLVVAERLRGLPEPDYTEAVDHLRQATEAPGAPVAIRLRAATWWARMLVDLGLDGFVEAYQQALRLLPRAAWQGLHRGDQLYQLTEHAGLAREAVGFTVMAGQPELAIELAELGRGVLSGQQLRLRIDLASIERHRPDLARRMIELAAILDDAGLSTIAEEAPRSLDERGQVAREWEQAFAEASSVLVEEALLLAEQPSYSYLSSRLRDPVVLINVAEVVSHAILIRPGGVEPVVVELPDLHEKDVDEAVGVLRGNAHARDGRDVAPLRPATPALGYTLDWLWRTIAVPVLSALGAHAPVQPGAPWPRLIWCPTGNLTRLPLHAARPLAGGDGVLDRVVSTYTTTIRALCRPDPTDDDDATLLVVAVPDADGLPPLPAVQTEATQLNEIVARAEVLTGSAATPEAVRAALTRHSHVHLACHGGWSAATTGTLRLALAGGNLTPLDLAQVRGNRFGFAYLSACDTMIGPANADDEGLHMAGALQLIGYRHVIATLWPIDDATAAATAADVYRQMVRPDRMITPRRAAFALHNAVRALRDHHPDAIALWAPYIHLGGFG